MKIFLKLLALVIMGLIAYMAYTLKSEWIAAVAFGGLVAGVLWMWSYFLAIQDKLKAYKRELEKNSVENSSSTSKVEVLEAKIEVLEKALKNALG